MVAGYHSVVLRLRAREVTGLILLGVPGKMRFTAPGRHSVSQKAFITIHWDAGSHVEAGVAISVPMKRAR